MQRGTLTAETLLSNLGLSVRAMNVCARLSCETVGALADVFRGCGPRFVHGQPNCGSKTLAELATVVGFFTHPAEELAYKAETPLFQAGLSVRALNVCESLGCQTAGDLLNFVQRQGTASILEMRNCGKGTLFEIDSFLKALSPSDGEAPDDRSDESVEVRSGESFAAAPLVTPAEGLLEAIERWQVPHGLPVELVMLPVRIQNWCHANDWNAVGDLLQNAGGMQLDDFLALENIGKKSAYEVLAFFDALRNGPPETLRKYLPIASGSAGVCLTAALNDAAAALDSKEVGMLELRLVEKQTLDMVAHKFKRTRELIRQTELRFLHGLQRALDWFTNERVELWQRWEASNDLAPLLAEKGVTHLPLLAAAGVAAVFEDTPEARFLAEYWLEGYRSIGVELMSSEELSVGPVDLATFAKERGREDLAARFPAWIEQNLRETISVTEGRAVRVSAKLASAETRLLYGRGSAEERWSHMHERLKAYHAEHGHVDVPSRWRKDPQLATWVSNQRTRRKNGALPEDQIALLDEVGMTWQSRERGTWEERYAEMVAFKNAHGHCEIPVVFPENPRLGRLVNTLRTQKANGTMSAERVDELEQIGFAWNSGRRSMVEVGGEVVSEVWNARYEELLAYKQLHGNCDVPAEFAANRPLANWVSSQRQAKKRAGLLEAREKLLESIGFNWRPNFERRTWEAFYTELLAYKEAHGDCDVPAHDAANSQLAKWVVVQRRNRRLGRLSGEHEERLSGVGFLWQSGSTRKPWNVRYAELLAYRSDHGHCDVSTKDSIHASLGIWVASQRQQGKLGLLSDEQVHLLNEMDFSWTVDSARKSWEVRYAELLAYRAVHSHCDVSTRDPLHASLGIWVAAQRQHAKHGRLTPEQTQKLGEAGFNWQFRTRTADAVCP